MINQGGKIIFIFLIALAGFFYQQILQISHSNTANAADLININTASLAELDTLPGIGPSKAQAIIDYRNINGDFVAIEDIKNVSGIGDATFNNIKDLIAVDAEESGPELEVEPESEPEPEPEIENEPEVEPKTEDEAEPTASTPSKTYKYGDVLINEFVSDPADGEVEFVELYNNFSSNINLDSWYLYDGSGAKTVLTGIIEKYFVIEKPKGNLNNSGDIIILKFEDVIIDQVAYGNWDDGDEEDNAPKAEDPSSVARKINGHNTGNNYNDFALTNTITKRAANIINNDAADDEYSDSLSSQYDYSNDIIISEIFPNPKGSDNENEFIELFNKGDKSVNLEGWILSDATNKNYELRTLPTGKQVKNYENITIGAGDYLTFFRKESGIALNNTSDAVELYQPLRDEPAQVVEYEKAKEDWSYCVVNATSTKLEYKWSEIATPGEENNIKTINHPPAADFSYSGELCIGQVIFFDSSDTVDEDGDKLNYFWDFGTGRNGATTTEPNPIFIYFQPGAKQVKLKVSDGENETEVEKIITLTSTALFQGEQGQEDIEFLKDYNIIISEFMPNPEGADGEGEWIKIQNLGSQSVNLIGWQLDDGEGGSSAYGISEDIFLNPNDFFVFSREDTKLALNNTVDSVRLFNNYGELVDSADYEKTKEGVSFVRQDGRWVYSGSEDSNQTGIVAVSSTVKTSSSVSSKSKAAVYAASATLENIREFDLGDKVNVTGTVAVLPGVFGTQYFYIVGSPGVQVYNYNKYFPDLTIGDIVRVSGELTESYGNLRLKTSSLDDIKITATSTSPEPAITECDKINEHLEAQLVRVKGEVVEKSGSTIWLDDGNDEIEVYIKTNTGINKNSIKEGATIAVIGIVYQNNDSYRIMPRNSDDIIIEGVNREGEVLGEISASDEWTLAQNNKKLKLMQYLLIISGGLIIVLAGVIWKEKK